MAATWNEAWAARSMGAPDGSLLEQVMAADGLDTSFGKVTEASWRIFVRQTSDVIGIHPGQSVFEVGCGAGAYLLGLYERGCDVAGLDTSPALIQCAREVMPRGRFVLAEACELNISEQYDFVISVGVFLYFPSLGYARVVLERMVRKSRRGIMVLDVPDLTKRDESLTLRRRLVGEEAYAKRYDGLEHLYLDKGWFADTLADLGIDRVQMDDQRIDGYANSAYRYNVFAWCGRV